MSNFSIEELWKITFEKAGKAPKRIITDRLRAYLDGIELQFGADTKHQHGSPFDVESNTNLIERFHGTLKDRLKVMRGLKSPETADFLIKGWLVFYNYIRPHESLDDKTPAEVARVMLPFKNWLEVAESEEPELEIPKGVYTPSRARKLRVRKPARRTARRVRNDTQTVVRGVRL